MSEMVFYKGEQMEFVIDWFGTDIIIRKVDEKLAVTVKASPSAMQLWALQYAQFVTVTKPQELADKIKATLKSAAERYES